MQLYIIFAYILNKQIEKPKEVLAIEYKKAPVVQQCSPSPPLPEPEEEVEKVEKPIAEPQDLLVISMSLFAVVSSANFVVSF